MVDGDEGIDPPLPLPNSTASSSGGGDGSGINRRPPPPVMTTVSRHYFGQSSGNITNASSSSAADDDDDGSHAFSIDIIENMQEDYGMYVWPCSIVLAEYVWQQRLRFSSKSVVELGAGTSLPGLVAAKVGADVTLTDNSNQLENYCFKVASGDHSCKLMGPLNQHLKEPQPP